MGNIVESTQGYKVKYKALHRHNDAIVDFNEIVCKRYKNIPNISNNMFIRVVNTTRNFLCHLILGKQNEDVMNRIAVNIYAIYLLVDLDMRRKKDFAFADVLNQYDEEDGVCYVNIDGWLDQNWRRSTKAVPKVQLKDGFNNLNDDLKYFFWTCVSIEVASRDSTWATAVNQWRIPHYANWRLIDNQNELEEFVLGAFYQQPNDVQKRNGRIEDQVVAQNVQSRLQDNCNFFRLIYQEEIGQSIFDAISHQLFVVALDQLWEKSKSLAKQYPRSQQLQDLFHQRLFQVQYPVLDNTFQTLKGGYVAELQQFQQDQQDNQQLEHFAERVQEIQGLQLPPQQTPAQIRQAVEDLLYHNPNYQVENSTIAFCDIIREVGAQRGLNLYDYRALCQLVANEANSWADHIVVVAIANLLQRDIKVLTPQRVGLQFYWINCLGDTDRPPLTLGRVGGMQYKSLRKREWQVEMGHQQQLQLQQQQSQKPLQQQQLPQMEKHGCKAWSKGWEAGWRDADTRGLNAVREEVQQEKKVQQEPCTQHGHCGHWFMGGKTMFHLLKKIEDQEGNGAVNQGAASETNGKTCGKRAYVKLMEKFNAGTEEIVDNED